MPHSTRPSFLKTCAQRGAKLGEKEIVSLEVARGNVDINIDSDRNEHRISS